MEIDQPTSRAIVNIVNIQTMEHKIREYQVRSLWWHGNNVSSKQQIKS